MKKLSGASRTFRRPGRVVFMLAALWLVAAGPLHAITFYTAVGSGVTYRDAHHGDPPYRTGVLSPVLEGGLRTRSRDLAGFHVRFLLDPEDTSHVASYYISGKRIFYLVPKTIYLGFSAGLHIEREYAEERRDSEDATIGSEEAHGLFNAALHAGLTFEIMDNYYLMLDCFAAQSVGRYFPYTANAWLGLMNFF
jgi:hypothetical protein